MSGTIQFTLTAAQMADFLTWRAQVEAQTGNPIAGVVLSFLVTRQGDRQIVVRPSTDQDLKLQGVLRLDGTYDTFAPHEEVLAEYDDLGFASTPILWSDVRLKLHLCDGRLLGEETTPRCYVECMHDPHQPFLPFRVSDDPELMEEDIVLRVFSYTPLPPTLHQRIQHFIRTNVAALLRHWHGEIGSFALLDALQPIESDSNSEVPGACGRVGHVCVSPRSTLYSTHSTQSKDSHGSRTHGETGGCEETGMNPAHTARLFEGFPHLYRGLHLPLTENLMSWGFQCEDGWFALVYQVSQQITEYAARHPAVHEAMATEVKEKFGTLRFYVRGADAHLRALLDTAAAQSAEICERDGTSGRLRVRQGHYQTLCDDCARTLGYHDMPPR